MSLRLHRLFNGCSREATANALERAQLNAAMFPALNWAHQVIAAPDEAADN